MYLDFIQKFTLITIAWKTILLIFPKFKWKNIKLNWSLREIKERKGGNLRIFLKEKDPSFTIMSYIYIIYLFLILCSKWWWIFLFLLLLGIISTKALKPYIKRNSKFNFNIWFTFFIDYVLTIWFLSFINPFYINYIKKIIILVK